MHRIYILLIVLAISFPELQAIAVAGVNEETVASVNGDAIKGLELRESLGLWGGAVSASGIPLEKKKEALDRLIDGRLLEQAARSKKWDKTEDFTSRVNERKERLLIPALFRMEIASGLKIDPEEIRTDSSRLRKDDKKLSKEDALARAKGSIWQREIRKLEQEVVTAARKEAMVKVDEETIARIGNGEKVEDNAVLGTAAVAAVRYGEVKDLLRQMSGGMQGGKDLGANPKMIREVVDNELTGIALLAYARKRDVENTVWGRMVHRDLERAILIDLFTEKEILKGVKVSDKEIGDAYAKHSQMLVRDGKKIPLSEVKEEIRQIVMEDKRKKAITGYRDKMKKKAVIKIDDKVLQKV